jgi:molybdopterin/thiamine biosynthesis adenylyltransferase
VKGALVVGIGAVGGHVAAHLARHGFELGLCDPDRVEAHNVGIQPLYGAPDVGELKVLAACAALKRLGATAKVRVLPSDVRALGVGFALTVDVLVCAADNRAAELHLGRLAALAGKPYLRASTSASEAAIDLVIVPPVRAANGACGVCHFSAADLALVDARTGCGGASREQRGSVASVPGALAGALAADCVAHDGLRAGKARLVRLAYRPELSLTTTQILPNDSCRIGAGLFAHGPGRYRLAGVRDALTGAALIEKAARRLRAPAADIAVDLDAPFSPARACAACGEERGPGFLRPGAARCPKCDAVDLRALLPASTRIAASALAQLPITLAALDAPVAAGFRFTTGRSHLELFVRR